MLDRDIRALLKQDYLRQYIDDEDARVIPEMALAGHQVRIDIGVVNGQMIGYEIKSDHDTLRRLPDQLDIYTKVFDKLTVICGPVHLNKVRDMVPSYCGILVATREGGQDLLEVERTPVQSPDLDGFRLASMLWNEEARALLMSHGIKGVSKMRRHELWRRIASLFDVKFISDHVRLTLKARVDWRE